MRLLRAVLLFSWLLSCAVPVAPCCAAPVADSCCDAPVDCAPGPGGACLLEGGAPPGVSAAPVAPAAAPALAVALPWTAGRGSLLAEASLPLPGRRNAPARSSPVLRI